MKRENIFTGTLDDKSLSFYIVKDKEDKEMISYPLREANHVKYVSTASVLFISNMLADGWTLDSVKVEKPEGAD